MKTYFLRRAVRQTITVMAVAVFLSWSAERVQADWPMWRNDAGRGATAEEPLAKSLHLQWTLSLPAPKPTWPSEQSKLQFDASYEPVVLGQRLFVPSMIHDSVTAYDTRSGKMLWQFYANGPVRFAPVATKGKVYFVSDDGHLYCVDARDGHLLWRFRGGPSDRKVLGNDRLISMWPARGGPVLYDDTIYFAAGIWPFMGIFIHAVDAETGVTVWTNSGSGSNYLVQPHNSPAFAGVAPQGYMAVNEEVLLVPGGRSVPAAYDRKTGKYLYYHIGSFSKKGGGYGLTASRDWFAQGGILCSARDGYQIGTGDVVTASDKLVLQKAGDNLTALDGHPTVKEVKSRDRKGNSITRRQVQFQKVWETKLPAEAKEIFLKAGNRLYASDGGETVMAIDLPSDNGKEAKLTWSGKISGTVWNMLASDQRLFVVSREGNIYCFGAEKRSTATPVPPQKNSIAKTPLDQKTIAGRILAKTGQTAGYGLVLGLSDVELVEQLAQQSSLHIIVLESDAKKASAARQRWHQRGLLGTRIAVMQTNPATAMLPPYMANLIICPDLQAAGFGDKASQQFLQRTFNVLRPYGGTAVLLGSSVQIAETEAAFAAQQPAGGKLEVSNGLSFMRRVGSLPGSASWTHHNADEGNSLVSQDERVKLPLGLLWFGGPSNQEVLPRHGHGPTPQVVGGRLIIEGPDMLRAVDVYTGRLLWQRELKDLGLYYNNTGHHPGAGAIGGNYVSLADAIYVSYGQQCLRLDPATGKTISTFTLPADETTKKPLWGHVSVYGDVLIAGSSPMLPFSSSRSGEAADSVFARYGEGSRRIVALDRHSGKVLWKRDAKFNFRHNTIVAGDGKVFCLDRMTAARLAFLKRRGQVPDAQPVLYALDARTGKVQWQHDDNVFGTWLAYSKKHNLLLQAGSKNRDRAKDEIGRGMTVYRADSGKVVWQKEISYGGPPLLHDKTIITQGSALSLLTAEPKTRKNPLTGAVTDWNFTRNYGCNTAIGSTHLLTFRSAAAGFFDLTGDGGTGNLGGFRSSCTANLIPADGVLNAPDYTRTCVCSYQNQCSLALIHMPEVEMWTFNSQKWGGRRVQRLGINFGAPGDRRDAKGLLWLDYPSVGGVSPDVPIEVTGKNTEYFRHHASLFTGSVLPWVGASGVAGAEKIRITLAGKDDKPRKYTVRLHFAEVKPRTRVFSVSLQGKEVLTNFDVTQQAGGANRTTSREFRGVEVKDVLEIAFPSKASANGSLLSGIEVVLED